MPSKHMTNGRRALRRFDAHMKTVRADIPPTLPSIEQPATTENIPSDILAMSKQATAEEIARIRDRWLKTNGQPKIVHRTSAPSQKKDLARLPLLKQHWEDLNQG